MISRLRWHLHDLDPNWDPAPLSLTRKKNIAADLAGRIGVLTAGISALEKQIAVRVRVLAPSLLAVPGVAGPTAAKIVGETVGVRWFRCEAAYARYNGTAPLPAWSANKTRHRLSRTGNRQLNCAIHRVAVTQKRCHPEAQAYLTKRITAGNTRTEALRALKRHLSDKIYQALMADAADTAAAVNRAA